MIITQSTWVSTVGNEQSLLLNCVEESSSIGLLSLLELAEATEHPFLRDLSLSIGFQG